jgi:hypothetical protein
MDDEERLEWMRRIEAVRNRLWSHEAGRIDVAEILSKIIQRIREIQTDTLWLEQCIDWMIRGLHWNANASSRDASTLVGLMLALSHGKQILAPLDMIHPDFLARSLRIDEILRGNVELISRFNTE